MMLDVDLMVIYDYLLYIPNDRKFQRLSNQTKINIK